MVLLDTIAGSDESFGNLKELEHSFSPILTSKEEL